MDEDKLKKTKEKKEIYEEGINVLQYYKNKLIKKLKEKKDGKKDVSTKSK